MDEGFLGNNHHQLYYFLRLYVLLTLLPIYISDRLHASPDKAGLLVTLFLIAAIVILLARAMGR